MVVGAAIAWHTFVWALERYRLVRRAFEVVLRLGLGAVGGEVFEAALRALAWRGRMVVIGFAGGQIIPTVRANYLLVKNIEVSGLQVSDYKKRAPDEVVQCFEELFTLYEAGKLAPFVMATYPLERFAEALRQVRDRSVRRKIILTPRV